MGSAASKVVSDLMAVLRVLNTAAPSLVDIFRVSISKLIFRMTKVKHSSLLTTRVYRVSSPWKALWKKRL